MDSPQKFLLGGLAGLIISLYTYAVILISAVEHEVVFSFGKFDYMFGMLFRVVLSALAGILWVYLNHNDEKSLSRLTVFQLGLIGPIALAGLLHKSGGESLPNITKSQVGGFETACQISGARTTSVGFPRRRPASNRPKAEFSEFGPVFSSERNVSKPSIASFVDGFLASNFAVPSTSTYEARFLNDKPEFDQFDGDASWFLIVGSHLKEENARAQLLEIRKRAPNVAGRIYPPFRENLFYAVVLASWVSKATVGEASAIAQKCELILDKGFAWQYPPLNSE